eukprot:gene29937-4090_t
MCEASNEDEKPRDERRHRGGRDDSGDEREVEDHFNRGTVKTWNTQRGFGFISQVFPPNEDATSRPCLRPGDVVQYTIGYDKKKDKDKAENVKFVEEGEQKKGVVAGFNSERGFGFISQNDGPDIFFHKSKVRGGRTLKAGDEVRFYEKVDKKTDRPMAVGIVFVKEGQKTQKVFEKKSNNNSAVSKPQEEETQKDELPKEDPPPEEVREIGVNVLGTVEQWSDTRGRGVVRRIGYEHTAVLLRREVFGGSVPEVGDIYEYDVEVRRNEAFAVNAERRERAPGLPSRDRDDDGDGQQRADDPPPPEETNKTSDGSTTKTKQTRLKDVAGAMFDMMEERGL